MFPTRAHVVMAWRQSGLLERTWVSLSYGFATPKVFDLCLSISLLILSHFHHLVCPTVAFCLSWNLVSLFEKSHMNKPPLMGILDSSREDILEMELSSGWQKS